MYVSSPNLFLRESYLNEKLETLIDLILKLSGNFIINIRYTQTLFDTLS